MHKLSDRHKVKPLELPTAKFAARLKIWTAQPHSTFGAAGVGDAKSKDKSAALSESKRPPPSQAESKQRPPAQAESKQPPPSQAKSASSVKETSQPVPVDALVPRKVETPLQPVFLLLSGSFNPVHLQHLAIFEAAKNALEQDNGKIVLGAYIAPSSDGYVNSKLGDEAMTLAHRSEMCRLLTASSDLVDVCDWGWASGPKTTQEIERRLGAAFGGACASLRGFEICGADFALRAHKWQSHGARAPAMVCLGRAGSTQPLLTEIKKCSPSELNPHFILVQKEGPDVSSTQVRKKLNSPHARDWQSLVSERLLAQCVLDYLLKHWDGSLFLKAKRTG